MGYLRRDWFHTLWVVEAALLKAKTGQSKLPFAIQAGFLFGFPSTSRTWRILVFKVSYLEGDVSK